MPFKDLEKRRAYNREQSARLRAENPEKYREANRRYRRNNPGAASAAVRKWEAKNPGKVKEYEAKRIGDPVRLAKVRVHSQQLRENQPDLIHHRKIKSAYGLTGEEYKKLFEAQGGGCAICGAKRSNARCERLTVDHCHDTKKVRGLLCTSCNNGIGRFKHDPALLLAAVEYLRS